SDTSLETGYTPQRFGDDARALSPVYQLEKGMPPTLAFHGDADKTVPLRQALALRDALVAKGSECELHVVPGGGHNFGNEIPGWHEKAQMIMLQFLQRHQLVEP
ncbi:MAG: prolyl oligopeptidase family serine peptidase, partial [Opitutaceae bacterium]